MAKAVGFTPQDAGRIGAAVRAYEAGQGPSYGKESPFVTPFEGARVAKTAGTTWTKGTYKNLFLWEAKDPAKGVLPVQSSNNAKILALNLFADIPTGKWVVCVPSEAGFYVVIAAEC